MLAIYKIVLRVMPVARKSNVFYVMKVSQLVAMSALSAPTPLAILTWTRSTVSLPVIAFVKLGSTGTGQVHRLLPRL